MRTARVATVLMLIGSVTLGGAVLLCTCGCSGSSSTTGQAVPDEEGQKVLQEKMKEYMAKRAAMKNQKKK